MQGVKHVENRKARKVHTCDLCHGKIEICELYDYQFNADGGASWEFKFHKQCYGLAITLNVDDGDGYDEGDFHNAVDDELARLLSVEAFDVLVDKSVQEKVHIIRKELEK